MAKVSPVDTRKILGNEKIISSWITFARRPHLPRLRFHPTSSPCPPYGTYASSAAWGHRCHPASFFFCRRSSSAGFTCPASRHPVRAVAHRGSSSDGAGEKPRASHPHNRACHPFRRENYFGRCVPDGPYPSGDIYNVEPAELGFYCLYTARDPVACNKTVPPTPYFPPPKGVGDCKNVSGVAARHAALLTSK